MIDALKTIDYSNYVTSLEIHKNAQIKDGIGLVNNATLCIPKDLIISLKFTNIYNTDGSNLTWDRKKSDCYENNRNAIIFNPCDKVQSNDTYIHLTLVNGKELITTHSRKVSII